MGKPNVLVGDKGGKFGGTPLLPFTEKACVFYLLSILPVLKMHLFDYFNQPIENDNLSKVLTIQRKMRVLDIGCNFCTLLFM